MLGLGAQVKGVNKTKGPDSRSEPNVARWDAQY
jgi:hypothetical protein